MTYLTQIQRAIDHIEHNLDGEIDVARVARVAGISRWHFQRIFKALTNETVKTYIRSRRLARALDKLLTTDERILDIAFAAGFESQAAFTRTFKRTFDITPAAYRRLGDKSLFLKKVRFDADYLEHIQHAVSLEPVVETCSAMKVVGYETKFFSVDSEKNNIAEQLPPLWDRFMSDVERITERVGGVAYGVVQQDAEDSELLTYVAGMEVPTEAGVPDGMVAVDIPQSLRARFTHRGPMVNMNNTVNFIYSSWLLESGFRHTYEPDLEIYGDDYHPTSPDSIVGYAIPVIDQK